VGKRYEIGPHPPPPRKIVKKLVNEKCNKTQTECGPKKLRNVLRILGKLLKNLFPRFSTCVYLRVEN
jgi:hypothetical protein